jgi:hypothetical protein
MKAALPRCRRHLCWPLAARRVALPQRPKRSRGRRPAQRPVPTFTPAPDNLTSEHDILNYNNFFEFTIEIRSAWRRWRKIWLITSPWQVAVGGLVRNPGVYDVDDLKRSFDPEERDLSPALRGNLVYGHPLAGLSRCTSCWQSCRTIGGGAVRPL